jgi:primosomal protein N' (replication factor Y)
VTEQDTQPLIPDTAATKAPFADIVVNRPVDRVFSYRIPEHLADQVAPGKRVRVPFGKTAITIGYCVGLSNVSRVKQLKDVIAVLDKEPIADAAMLRLTRWIADYYFCSWGEALECAIPGGVKRGKEGRLVEFVSLAVSPADVPEIIESLAKRNAKQGAALKALVDMGREVSTQYLAGKAGLSNAGPIKALAKRGVLRLEKRRVTPDPYHQLIVERTRPLVLTPEQKHALDTIVKGVDSGNFGVALLHGVTGSGKTEVYLQAIDHVVAQGRQAIVLVPEISLTPQTVLRFRQRFDAVAVLHSMLGDSQRHAQWMDIREGRAQVVIGPRSAIFAPMQRLGLIVIDEEHESSFKQQNTPRYHARDVAILRASNENCYVVLGSATPSLESYYNAITRKYELLELSERVEKLPLPKVELVDMREEGRETKRFPLISRHLRSLIKETLAKKEQVMLFLNRRGFATYIDCPQCGLVMRCKQCDVSLTYHKKRDELLCHYCNTRYPAPEKCPGCGYEKVRYFGIGTEKIEEEIQREFPDARMLRMDSDTMTTRTSHERAFHDVLSGKVDILLGTQMIAKGLHFPGITLVGVVLGDTALYIPDFRSAERTFQLLAQVSGRTGRGELGGRVVIQTFRPDHFSVQLAAKHDYETFARKEMDMRRSLGYPPYSRMARFLVEGGKEFKVCEKIAEISNALQEVKSKEPMRIVGPAPAPIAFIEGKARYHVLAMTPTSRGIRRILADLGEHLKSHAATLVSVDVDPIDLL